MAGASAGSGSAGSRGVLRRLTVVATVVAVALAGLAPAAVAQDAEADTQDAEADTQDAGDQGGFEDVAGGVHKPGIDALNALGVFDGTECAQEMFCPGEEMQRSAMAVWLVRVLDEQEPPPISESSFADVDSDEWWLPYVERLAELEVTEGCKTEPLRFCPDRSVTRAQMATFLVRAFGLEAAEPAGFTDTAGDAHEGNIDALAAARVTAGCTAEPLRYCPDRSVTRAQMATFLARALGLIEIPTPTEDATEDTGDEPELAPTAFAALTTGGYHAWRAARQRGGHLLGQQPLRADIRARGALQAHWMRAASMRAECAPTAPSSAGEPTPTPAATPQASPTRPQEPSAQ